MSGLIDQVRKGCFHGTDDVIFLHTGGAPALFAYEDALLAWQETARLDSPARSNNSALSVNLRTSPSSSGGS
jgi:hypothetical protein